MKKKIIVLSLLLLNVLVSSSQNYNFNNNNIQEVIIKTDRQEYIAGEEIWFKLYVNSKTEKAIAYVELINNQGFSINRKKVLLNHGNAKGYLNISDTLSTGFCQIIAYTYNIKTYGYKSLYGNVPLLIYNPERNTNNNKRTNRTILLSTENNDLVSGLTNKIYWKYNSKIDIINNIYIKTENGDTISSEIDLNTRSASFIPTANKTYWLSAYSADTTYNIKLPTVKNDGIVVNLIDIKNDSFTFSIRSTEKFRINNHELLIHLNDLGNVFKTIQMVNDEMIFHIPKNSLVSKNILTIKNNLGQVKWKRLIVNPSDNVSAEVVIHGLKDDYETREPVSISVQLNSNKLLNGIISCSVTKIPERPIPERDSIFNKLSGGNTIDDAFTLNYLILFDSITNGEPHIGSLENDGINITGRVYNAQRKPLLNKNIYLCVIDSVADISFDKLDSIGKFNFKIFPDRSRRDIMLKVKSEDKNCHITIDDPFLNNYESWSIPYLFDIGKEYKEYLHELYINYRIQQVYKTGVKTEYTENLAINKEWKNYSFYGEPDHVIKFENYMELDSVLEYFHELVHYVSVRTNENKREYKIIDNYTKQIIPGKPIFFINGVIYENDHELVTLDPKICDRIEIVNTKYLLYDKTYSGIISLFTKDPTSDNIVLPKNSSRVNYLLFDEFEEFEFPMIKENNIPYFKNTLFWQPNILIKNTETKLDFYTGDDIGSYVIDIFGFTDNGEIIKERRTFTIKK